MADQSQLFSVSSPEWQDHGQRQEAHQQVADGQDVGGHGEAHVRLDDHPELDGEGDAVEEGRGDANDDWAGEERATEARVHESHDQMMITLTLGSLYEHLAWTDFILTLWDSSPSACEAWNINQCWSALDPRTFSITDSDIKHFHWVLSYGAINKSI